MRACVGMSGANDKIKLSVGTQRSRDKIFDLNSSNHKYESQIPHEWYLGITKKTNLNEKNLIYVETK